LTQSLTAVSGAVAAGCQRLQGAPVRPIDQTPPPL